MEEVEEVEEEGPCGVEVDKLRTPAEHVAAAAAVAPRRVATRGTSTCSRQVLAPVLPEADRSMVVSFARREVKVSDGGRM